MYRLWRGFENVNTGISTVEKLKGAKCQRGSLAVFGLDPFKTVDLETCQLCVF
jgi:hypothetical protein